MVAWQPWWRHILRPPVPAASRLVAIYAGRFQPFHRHHYLAFEFLRRRFADAYIGVVARRDRQRNPLSFEEQIRFMAHFEISRGRVFTARNPYLPWAFLRRFDRRSTAVVFGVGFRDVGRMLRIGKGERYYRPLPQEGEPMRPYPERGYYVAIPRQVAADEEDLAGSEIRRRLGDRGLTFPAKQAYFRHAFGWYDEELLHLLIARCGVPAVAR